MHVFVTGANGFIGRAVVKELHKHGHTVLGLSRNEETARAFKEAGIQAHVGNLEDLESLRSGARASDGVIHLAFVHDFNDIAKAISIDRAAIEAMSEAMVGTDKPLIIASGTLLVAGVALATEDTEPKRDPPFGLRAISADVVYDFSKKGVRGSVIRLPPTVHGPGDKGFMTIMSDLAKKNGFVTYVGDGDSRWPAVHRDDSAVLFRLALEKGTAGATYNAVAEEGVAWSNIAAALGKKLGLPAESKSLEEAQQALGFLAFPVSADNPTSSERTKAELSWQTSEIGLLADLEANY